MDAHLPGRLDSIDLKICQTRVSDAAASSISHPPQEGGGIAVGWGAGETLLLPCRGGTVLEVGLGLMVSQLNCFFTIAIPLGPPSPAPHQKDHALQRV